MPVVDQKGDYRLLFLYLIKTFLIFFNSYSIILLIRVVNFQANDTAWPSWHSGCHGPAKSTWNSGRNDQAKYYNPDSDYSFRFSNNWNLLLRPWCDASEKFLKNINFFHRKVLYGVSRRTFSREPKCDQMCKAEMEF